MCTTILHISSQLLLRQYSQGILLLSNQTTNMITLDCACMYIYMYMYMNVYQYMYMCVQYSQIKATIFV